MTTATARWVAAGLLAVGALAGCGNAGDGNSDSSSAGSTASSMAGGGDSAGKATAEDRAAAGAGGSSGAAAAPPGAPLALATDRAALRAAPRDVVRTGAMSLRVAQVDETAGKVRALATGAGGFVADAHADAGDHEVDLTLRVPADRFEDVRADVADLGEVTTERIEAKDVTAEVVDVDSRVRSMRASVDRVRALLAGSGDVVQLATVEGELARRETELEALLAQQRVLKDQVALGTLTVHLSRHAEARPVEGVPGFGSALRRGGVALVDVARVALAAVGFVLPFAVPAALAFLVVRLLRRRGRDASPAEAPS